MYVYIYIYIINLLIYVVMIYSEDKLVQNLLTVKGRKFCGQKFLQN